MADSNYEPGQLFLTWECSLRDEMHRTGASFAKPHQVIRRVLGSNTTEVGAAVETVRGMAWAIGGVLKFCAQRDRTAGRDPDTDLHVAFESIVNVLREAIADA